MSVTTLTAHELRKAADIRERIDALQKQLDDLLGRETSQASVAEAEAPRRRNMSAAGRARIAAAAKARWAAFRAAKGQRKQATRRKSKFSVAARSALSAAAKARWAKAKETGKSTL